MVENVKNPFAKNKDYPQTEAEEKWNFVGFFSSFLCFFIIGFPLLMLGGEVRNIVELSPSWFVVMGGMVAWPLFCLFTLRWWLQLSHNFGLLMYRLEQASEKKNKSKEWRSKKEI